MFNPIEEKRRFVQAQIQKSFDSGINVNQESDIEKAHKDGDHHPTKPWVWVSSANGGKGDWRVEGGRAHKKAGVSITTPAPRKPGSTNEIERMTPTAVHNAILGLNNTGTNVKDKGDHFFIEFDANDFTTHGQRSPQIDRIAKYLESMGASCVIGKNNIKAYKKVEAKKNTTNKTQSPQDKVKDIMQQFDDTTMDEDEFDEYVDSFLGNDMGQKLRKQILESNKSFSDKRQAYKDAVERHLGLKPKKYSEMDIKDAKKDLVGKVVTLKDYWPDGRGGTQDAIGEIKNVRLYGKDKLPIAEISYPNGDEQLVRLDEIDDGKMKDSYKTPISVGDDKTGLNAVKNKVGDFGNMKLTEILDSLDDWGDDEWNNSALNKKLSDAISNAIKKERISETEFNNIAKKYQGLDLMYSDYAETKPDFEEYSKKFIEDYRKNHPNDKAKNSELRGKALDAYEKKYESDSDSDEKDKREKIARKAGFKNYEEMSDYQNYVTTKNLLKKRSTSAGLRLLIEGEVAKYEKDHADLLSRLAKGKK